EAEREHVVYRRGLVQLTEAGFSDRERHQALPGLARRPVSRDAKCEAGSAWRGVAGEVAVVLLGDAAGDGEAQAVAGLAGIESNEALENPLAFAVWYARPVIGDVRLGVAVAPAQLHVDLAVGFDCGEGVLDEVAEHALERIGVAAHEGVVVGPDGDGGVGGAHARVFDER